MEAQTREIKNYLKIDGKSPFEDWYYSLRDRRARKKFKSDWIVLN
jgi:putative component of toxin-antitoxin plasmid stabilization module